MLEADDVLQDPPIVGAEHGGQRAVNRRVSAVRWAAFVMASWVFLRPVLLTPIFADDYINPFSQFPSAGLSPIELMRYGWNAARGAGHLNFVGQVIGAFVNGSWIVLMGVFGVRYSTVYAGVKLIIFILTAVAASGFVRASLDVLGRTITPWRCRLLVSTALFSMLQIHIAWSNDPVASYPMSGFASAAIGFLVMSAALKALRSGSSRSPWLVGLLGTISVLYYEINVAAVVSIVPLAIWHWRSLGGGRTALRATLKRSAPMVVLPAVLVVLLKVLISPSSGTYAGTELAVGGNLFRGLVYGIVGTLPGSAWRLSRDWLAMPISLRTTPVMILVVVFSGLAVLHRRFPVSASSRRPVSVISLLLLAAAPATYWLGSTVIQTSTQKVQDEAPRIGYVYNYYAMGVTSLAVILVMAAMSMPSIVGRLSVLKPVVVAVVLAVVSVQYLINWNITMRFSELVYPSRQLLVTFSDQPPEPERCSALLGWTLGGWPSYYEISMVDGLQSAYEYFHDEPFCSGFVRPPD